MTGTDAKQQRGKPTTGDRNLVYLKDEPLWNLPWSAVAGCDDVFETVLPFVAQ
jgi:hypothetical protein